MNKQRKNKIRKTKKNKINRRTKKTKRVHKNKRSLNKTNRKIKNKRLRGGMFERAVKCVGDWCGREAEVPQPMLDRSIELSKLPESAEVLSQLQFLDQPDEMVLETLMKGNITYRELMKFRTLTKRLRDIVDQILDDHTLLYDKLKNLDDASELVRLKRSETENRLNEKKVKETLRGTVFFKPPPYPEFPQADPFGKPVYITGSDQDTLVPKHYSGVLDSVIIARLTQYQWEVWKEATSGTNFKDLEVKFKDKHKNLVCTFSFDNLKQGESINLGQNKHIIFTYISTHDNVRDRVDRGYFFIYVEVSVVQGGTKSPIKFRLNFIPPQSGSQRRGKWKIDLLPGYSEAWNSFINSK